jgi:hypothetical protein
MNGKDRVLAQLKHGNTRTLKNVCLSRRRLELKSRRTHRSIFLFCRVALNRRGHLSSECTRRILFRKADLTQERLETWNGAERVGHGIHVQENQVIGMFLVSFLEQGDSVL